MSNIIEYFTHLLQSVANFVPLPVFAFVGALVEEVIAPIPSPLVMTFTGSLAAANSASLFYIFVLALIGSVGKTLGSWIVYVVTDKAEDIVVGKFGKFIGVSHKQIEQIGSLLNNGIRDDVILFLLRAIPIIPTAPVSVICGVIKLNMRTYLVSTFFGTLVRNMIYLYLGYTGVGALASLNEGFESWEKLGYLIIFLLFAAGVAFMYFKRSRGGDDDVIAALTNRFKKKS